MAQDSWPSPAHNSRAITDLEYEKLAARFSDDGVYGSPSDTAVVSPGTGLSVNIRADVYASLRGHSWYSGSSTATLSIAANATGQTRKDRIVLRLDRATWTVRAVVRQGTSSTAPDLVQQTTDTGVYEIPLAVVTVLAGASAVTVTRSELYAGARVRPCTSSTRNPSPIPGEVAVETDTGRVRVWNGAAWVLIYDNPAEIVVDAKVSNWTVGVSSVLEVQSGTAHLRFGTFQRTSSTLTAAADSRLPILIPAAYVPPKRDQFALAYCTRTQPGGRITVFSAVTGIPGQVLLTQHPSLSVGEYVMPANISWAVS
ncbi:hypothetical protein [Streptomyces sp. 900105245]